MTTVTLSKKITKGEELIVVQKRAYDAMERVYRRFRTRTSDEIWREMEAEADADIKAGRFEVFRNKKTLLRALNKLKR